MGMTGPPLRAPGLIGLVVGSAVAAPVATLFGLTLTGDRLIGCAALVFAAALLCAGRVKWTAVHWTLAIFVAIQAATSLARAASWPQGLKFVSIYALGFGCFVVACELARGSAGRAWAERAWLGTGAVVGALGAVLAFWANVTQSPLWGTGATQMVPVAPDRMVVVFGGKVAFPEWNLLSSFLLVTFALALWRWSPPAKPRQRLTPGQSLTPLVVLACAIAGLVFGVTRAAWIGMAAISIAWVVRARPGLGRVTVLAVLVAVPVTLQGLSLGASPIVTRIVDPLMKRQDWNLLNRGVVNRAVAESWQTAPVIGQGAGSSNQLTVLLPGGLVGRQLWTGNMELFVLHDSGVVGLAALLAMIGVAAWLAYRAARSATPGWRDLGWPLAASGLALLFAWQFTHALWLMYPYVFLGILVACAEPGAEG